MEELITSNKLSYIEGIVHGFGVRGIPVDRYCDDLFEERPSIFSHNQIHGNVVHNLDGVDIGTFLEGDAFISSMAQTICYIRTADCVPILIADSKRRAIGAVHAGWRGTAQDICGETIGAMVRAFGVMPQDCIAAIGPRICGRCFEVGPEVISSFRKLGVGNTWIVDKRHVDLGIANFLLLERAGVRQENIDLIDRCTYCDNSFCSFRRDRTETGRQSNFISLI